jgi:mannan endo-1,4-beta-mannosidase
LDYSFQYAESSNLAQQTYGFHDGNLYLCFPLSGKVYENALKGGPLAGSNIWAWGGFGRPHPVESVLDNPAAYVGDPLEEMQGLNSIYVTDTSTMRIIRTHTMYMQGLSGN